VLRTISVQVQDIHDLLFKTSKLPKQDKRAAINKAKAEFLLKHSFKSK
jgi:hypothetical protein